MMAKLSIIMRIQGWKDSLTDALRRLVVVAVISTAAVAQNTAMPAAARAPTDQGLKPVLSYISSAWDTLTRSMTDCASVVDPKIKVAPVLDRKSTRLNSSH